VNTNGLERVVGPGELYPRRGPVWPVTLREGAGAPGHTSLIAPIPPTSRSRRLQLCAAVVDSPVCVAVFAGRAVRRGWLVPQQLRELGDVGSDPPGLVAGQ
jgi:hypothetical protein